MPARFFYWRLLLTAALLGSALPPSSLQAQPTGYDDAAITYFLEVALGSEYGSSEAVVHKWAAPMRLRVEGAPTEADQATLDAVMETVNAITGQPTLERVTDGSANATIHFTPPHSFAAIEPNYVPGNLGFFWVNWTGQDDIFRATILVASTEITQQERAHLIREEVTQSLGLMNDSNRYAASIFYAPWTTVTAYAPIDSTLIEMLYLPQITAGMSDAEAEQALRQLTTSTDDPLPPLLSDRLSAYPNPAAGRTTLTYTLSAPGPVRLVVYDLLGRRVAVLADDVRRAGEHTARLPLAGMPAGRYLVRLETRRGPRTIPLTLLH